MEYVFSNEFELSVLLLGVWRETYLKAGRKIQENEVVSSFKTQLGIKNYTQVQNFK